MEKHRPPVTLEGKGLSLGYLHQKNRKEILHELDFQLFRGELTCLLGPNGVGKSTLVKAILAQIKPWAGEILLDRKPIQNLRIEDLAKRISVVLTDPVFPGNMTVGQLVALGRTPHTGWMGKLNALDREIVEKALLDTKISDLRDERLGEISDGQRQKAMIARALAQDGQLMILDEPTAHLDLGNRLEIMHLLQDVAGRQEKSVLVVTHDLDIAVETADRFWLLNREIPLITGSPEDLILSGQINRLFPEKYHFSIERGKMERKSSREGNWKIEGDPTLTFWIEKALRKAGIDRIPEPIQVEKTPFSILCRQLEFHNISAFVHFLKFGSE